MQNELEFKIEKPFTDRDEKYTVLNSKEKDCFEVHNLVSGKTYIVNPFKEICTCPDFLDSYGSVNNGDKKTCKHIDFLSNDKRILPLIEKYDSVNSKNNDSNSGLTSVVPEVVDQDNVPYSLMERKDENQIMDELIRGNVIKEYVYDFKQNGREIVGLSYSGVVHVALSMGHIHTGEPVIQEMNGGYLAKVPATDIKKNVSTWGVSFQPKKMKLRDGSEIDDKFAIQKVVAKASRNAMRHLFPEKIVLELINSWRKNHGK